MNGRKFLILLLTIAIMGCMTSCKDTKPSGNDNDKEQPGISRPTDYAPSAAETVSNLAATDAYGRSFGAVDGFDPNKKVGIFYFVWTGRHNSAAFDNSKLTLEELKSKENGGVHHYWGEPLYGYYDSEDPWVIRKHIELFVYAGIDYICLDTTNNLYWDAPAGCDYRPAIFTLLDTLLEIKAQGFAVPQVMFYTNTASGAVIERIYDAFYDTDTNPELRKYKSLWFNFEDTAKANRARKPWIAGVREDFEKLDIEIQDTFYLKDSQWPNQRDGAGQLVNLDNGMPWMSWASDGKQYNHNGIMSVSMAQHPTGVISDSVLEGNYNGNRGRGWSWSDKSNNIERALTGSNFQEQWDNAILAGDEVNNVFITGWNEWVAQKQVSSSRQNAYFVDCFNMEFSRDAEMMKGGYGDAYYIQMCDNIRRFKSLSAPGLRTDVWSTSIDLDGGEEQWEGTRGYLDITGDTAARNFRSANRSLPDYKDSSGRNDIAGVRITYDKNNLYFLVTCKDNITAYESGENWMNILLKVSGAGGTNWEGYTHVINRSVSGNTASVERLDSAGAGTKTGDAQIKSSGRTLTVIAPRSALGLTNGATLEFKVADNVTKYKDINDYYVTGDCAPMGRLNYTAIIK